MFVIYIIDIYVYIIYTYIFVIKKKLIIKYVY